MAKFWALSTNDDTLVTCAVAPYDKELGALTGDAGGWGLGYYFRGEVLQRVEPKGPGEILDVSEVVQDMRADLIIMHTRVATVGSARRENIHPFRFKDWLFAHNGTVGGFEAIKDQVMGVIPSFIRRNIKGDTDSEHVFHLFLSFLYDAGLLSRPDIGVEAISDALIRTCATIDELAAVSGARASTSSIVLSDGYSLVVGSRGVAVDYLVIDGLSNCSSCRQSVNPDESTEEGIEHTDITAVLVRSGDEPAEVSKKFNRLDDNSLMMVSKNHDVTFRSFG